MLQEKQQIEKKQNKKLNLVLLAISAFFSQAVVYMYYGLIVRQGQFLGAPSWAQTLLPMSTGIAVIATCVLIGMYADKSGRRKELVLTGLVFAIVFNALMAISTSWQELLIFRTIGGGIYSAVFFLYVIFFIFQLPPEKRGLGVGMYMGLSTAGSILFSLLGGIWAQTMGFPTVYWIAALLGVFSLVTLLPVSIPRVKAAGVSTKQFGKAISTRGVFYPGFVFIFSSAGVLGAVAGVPIIIAMFGANLTIIGLVYAVQGLLSAIGMVIGGILVDKLGPRNLMVAGGLIGGVVTLTIPFVGVSWLTVAAMFWIINFLWAVTYPGPQTSATASVARELSGTAVNTITMLLSIGSIMAGLLAGPLIEMYGWQTAFYVFGAFIIVSGILALGIPKIKKAESH